MTDRPQLILVEGAPGLGKTTTVTNLAAALRARGEVRAVFCHEHDHPLHAFWDWGDGCDPDQVVTEPFDPEKFIVRLLARTYAFVDRVLTERLTAVMETYPFQSPVRNMLKMLGTEADCSEYFRRFCDAVAFCDPLLVYFEREDWGARLMRLAAERGERFNDVFFDAFYRSPWGREHSASRPQDVIDFCEHYLRVCERLLDLWPYRLLRFDPVTLGPEGTVQRVLSHLRPGRQARRAACAPGCRPRRRRPARP